MEIFAIFIEIFLLHKQAHTQRETQTLLDNKSGDPEGRENVFTTL